MISLFKETLKTFFSRQVLTFFVLSLLFDYINTVVKNPYINYFVIGLLNFLLLIFLYQYLLKKKINVKDAFYVMGYFFILRFGLIAICIAPPIIAFYFMASDFVETLSFIFGSYLLVRLNITLPILIANGDTKIINILSFTKEKFYFWFVASVVLTMPILGSYFVFFDLEPNLLMLIVGFLYIINPVFYSVYYKSKKTQL